MKYFKLAPPRLHSSKVLHKHSCISNKKQHPHFCIPTISYLVISSLSFFFLSFWRNLRFLWNLISQVMQPGSLGKLCLLALALSEQIHSFFFSFMISRWQITTDNFVFLPSDIRWPTRRRLENANWRSPWPLPMMLENTPFLSRIHTEKFQPLPACWRKVFSVLLFLCPGIFITSECPISQTHLLCWQPFECIKKKALWDQWLTVFLHLYLQSNMKPIWSCMTWHTKLKWQRQWFRSPLWSWVNTSWNRGGWQRALCQKKYVLSKHPDLWHRGYVEVSALMVNITNFFFCRNF